MKNRATKWIAWLLVMCLMIASAALVACNNEEEPEKTPSNSQTNTPDTPDTPGTTPDEEEPDEQDARIPLELPEKYYGNNTRFNILEWSANKSLDIGTAWIPWEEGAVEEPSDLMSNAVFARNAYIEEKYGIEITAEYAFVNDNYTQRITQDAETSSNEIQLASMRSLNAWALIEAGLYLDMNEYAGEILHTDQPWWVQDAVASYTLGNSLYVTSTEMLLRDKGATATVYFNTKIANDYGLDYFYDLVESGSWTLEDMIASCDIVATSLDGDDLLNSGKDLWGAVNGDDPVYYLYAAAGRKLAYVDEDGYIVHDFGDKESIDIIQTIFEEVMYADWYANTYCDPAKLEGAPESGPFESDLALFNLSLVKTSYMNLRDMETEYGILPMPKYDASQDNYNSLVWVHHDCVIGIPSAVADPEMCAIIFEELSYEGYYTVTPVLYETLLLNRLAKSAEAKRSLEIIFETRVYDPGQYWDDVANTAFPDRLLRHTATHTSNIASLWESCRSATEVQMEKVNEFIDSSR